MTFSTTTLTVSDETLAGPARQGEAHSPFWRRVQELLTLKRLHVSSDEIIEIAIRYDLTDEERMQVLERLAQKKQGVIDMFPTSNPNPTPTNMTVNNLSATETARRESAALATDISRQIVSRAQHIQMLAIIKVLGELIADSVNTRQLGPVEGLLDEIESNLDFDNGMTVRQYTRGLAALAEDIRCRLANL